MDKELIYNPFTDKYSKMNKYGGTAKKIYRYLIDETGAEPTSILPQDLSYNEDTGRFVKVQQGLDTTNTRRLTYARVKSAAMAKGANELEERMSVLRAIMKSYAGQTIQRVKKYADVNYDVDFDEDTGKDKIEIHSINMITDSEIVEVPETTKGFSSWWKKGGQLFFMIDSAVDIFNTINDHISIPY